MKFEYNDGGREKYFKGKGVGDCVTRAITIATNFDYKEVYDKIKSIVGYSPRNGIKKSDTKKVMKEFGFDWVSYMGIGTGCTNHLRDGEVPNDKTIICKVSGHIVCIKNGIINDTFDCSRDGNRCVYGYWYKEMN